MRHRFLGLNDFTYLAYDHTYIKMIRFLSLRHHVSLSTTDVTASVNFKEKCYKKKHYEAHLHHAVRRIEQHKM